MKINHSAFLIKIIFCVIVLLTFKNNINAVSSSIPIDTFYSHLPIVIIETPTPINDWTKIKATMGVIMNANGAINHITDPYNNYYGYIGIEIRGQSSNWAEMLKKSYSIETRNIDSTNRNVELMGLPSDNDWVLIASYSDKSLIRNPLTYCLGRKIGINATRSKFCEVFINSEYLGVYMLGEKTKIGKTRVDIATLLPSDTLGDELTGGYLLKVDKGLETNMEGTPLNGWFSEYKTVPWVTNSILFHDPSSTELKEVQKNYIHAFVDSFENALYDTTLFADNKKGYCNYINVQSFINYYLISELVRNIDAYRISTFLYKDKNSKNRKLSMGPLWDYDLAWGNANYMNGADTAGWIYCPDTDGFQPPFWWKHLLKDSTFNNEMKCTWQKLRKNELNDSSIFYTLDSMVAVIGPAANRNFKRWDILTKYVWPNAYIGNTYTNEVKYVKNWAKGRLAWIDANLPGTCRYIPEIIDTTTNNDSTKYPPDSVIIIYPPNSNNTNLTGAKSVNISLSPIPFTHVLNIAANNLMAGSYTVIVSDITRCVVWQSTFNSPTNGIFNYSITSLNSLQAGVYIISIENKGKLVYLGKILKQ